MLYLYCAHRIVRQLFVVIASSPSLVSPHLFVPSTGFRQAEASADSASKPSEYSHSSMRTLPWLSCAINTLRLVQPAVFREWSRSASCSPVGPSTTNEKTTGTTKKDKVNECIHSCDYSHHRQSDNSEDHEDDDDNENDSDGDDDNDNDDSDDDDDEDDDDDDDHGVNDNAPLLELPSLPGQETLSRPEPVRRTGCNSELCRYCNALEKSLLWEDFYVIFINIYVLIMFNTVFWWVMQPIRSVARTCTCTRYLGSLSSSKILISA